MNKKERETFYNKLQGFLPKQDYIKFINIMGQLESELSDLRKKAYSVEFAEKRVKTLYLNNQNFKKFLIKIIGENTPNE